MRCPYCFQHKSSVIDSRVTSDQESIRRRRECSACERRFTTYEQAESVEFTVVKRDGRKQPFSREKLMHGIIRACNKRPVTMPAIEQLTHVVEATLRKEGATMIPSSRIGTCVAEKLKALDPIAYVRYTSVLHQFSKPKQFTTVIEKLEHENKRRKPQCKQSLSHKNVKM